MKSLLQDYQQIVESAAIGEVAATLQLAVAGNDRASFLQGLLTNDVQALKAGDGCYAAWLTPQGRMLTDMHVLESDGMMLLDVPEAQGEATVARLDQFLFSEDVKLGSLAGALTTLWVHGPAAAAALEQSLDGAGGLGAWPQCHHEHVGFAGESLVLARIDQLAVPGYCAYLSAGNRAALVAALEAAGARQVSPDAIAAARIEAGYPLFGTDMTADTIPLEAGIEPRAISTTKGCYVGQEVIIRVLHRGHGRVARKLVTLKLDGEGAAARAKVVNGDREVGVVTSAALSPASGAIALAYVHRDLAVDDARVEVETAAGRLSATVRVQPLRSQ
ncbi:MAG TPA: glycine cleavage T C-terminal barrel domain-containing protein [Vicinamibacterales bacterium]|nr:glycine cleavage T C-terminal barrel domain-containing protein [Vicinamibacterales bacterium]